VALIRHRHRRAATALLAALPLVNGWTDLGRRTLPDGSRIDQLLVGQGQAIACLTSSIAGGVEKNALAAARAANATAAALGLSGARVQPVILSDREKPRIERFLVNDGGVAASVIVTAPRHIEAVTRLAPRRRGHRRCAVLTAALLPLPAARSATR